jgi:hypothetical protein
MGNVTVTVNLLRTSPCPRQRCQFYRHEEVSKIVDDPLAVSVGFAQAVHGEPGRRFQNETPDA